MTDHPTFRLRVRQDSSGTDVYDLTNRDRNGIPPLIGRIIPAGEGYQVTPFRGDQQAVLLGTVNDCLAWLAEPLPPERLDHDIAWLGALVGQMTERRSLGQTKHVVRLADDVARAAARIGAAAQAIARSEGDKQ